MENEKLIAELRLHFENYILDQQLEKQKIAEKIKALAEYMLKKGQENQ